MDNALLLKFGERVRFLRKKQNMSQEELAHRADVHRTYIGMIERGEKNLSLTNIDKIANALHTTLSELFTDFSNA